MLAQNVLSQIILADETEGEDRDKKWSESYCLKKRQKMLKQGWKKKPKKQWMHGKCLEIIETVLILKENIFSQSGVYMQEKTVNK